MVSTVASDAKWTVTGNAGNAFKEIPAQTLSSKENVKNIGLILDDCKHLVSALRGRNGAPAIPGVVELRLNEAEERLANKLRVYVLTAKALEKKGEGRKAEAWWAKGETAVFDEEYETLQTLNRIHSRLLQISKKKAAKPGEAVHEARKQAKPAHSWAAHLLENPDYAARPAKA